MILGFDIRQNFRRQSALAIERPPRRKAQQGKRERCHSPENDNAVHEAPQQESGHEFSSPQYSQD
jgi:hypothetical protein